MERTVVRCAEGHVFNTASFPMQQAERLGPGRLVRCPRCARLRSVVPVTMEILRPVIVVGGSVVLALLIGWSVDLLLRRVDDR
ncbi:hypothetical protein AB0885_16335, partial [Streptomyces sp. NPDC005534]|uniref:hypothetical protein n=1 Tax=Streptomyces sp. NPDC005534 TaxID=3155714 RepID=UPI0034567C58